MKRMLVLIGALLLMLDLADDGCLGKAKFVCPTAPIRSSVNSHQSDDLCKVDSSYELLPAVSWGIPRQCESRPVTPRFHHTYKLIDYYHSGSSGGLPL